MSLVKIYTLLGLGTVMFLFVGLFFAWPFVKGGLFGGQVRNLTGRSKNTSLGGLADTFERVTKQGVEGEQVKMTGSSLTLAKKLKFAQWKMSIPTFHAYAIVISFVLFIISFMKLNVIYQALSLLGGHAIMNALVTRAMNKRFAAFDRDYAPFLLSLVGLLKTGMNPLQALSAAAEALEDGSLVRLEVEVMLERLRLGVHEEKSVGAFGEDINHPEIELFVQALLLSRRVGGTLSDTLDRLSRQVRRRQYFRGQAVAAVGLQRGSIWFILGIQAGLMFYIYIVVPEFVIDSFTNPLGWQIWQGGGIVMGFGMWWVRQVSKIRV